MSNQSAATGVGPAGGQSSGPAAGGQGLAVAASVLLGAVLAFSAITKMMGPKAFVASVERFAFVPFPLASSTALVGLEFGLGILLITGIFRRAAAWISLPMILFFLGMLVYAAQAGLESCGCFGELIKIPPAAEIVIDSVLLVLVGVVLWRGRSVNWSSAPVRHALAYGGIIVGAFIFLTGNPAGGGEEEVTVELAQLDILQRASPSVALPQEGFLFFFSADCDHCWAFSSTVSEMAKRLPDFQTYGVTFSDPQTLGEFQLSFAPEFPILVVTESEFHRVTRDYPVGVWISQGQVEQAWSGFIPSYRELAEMGGYDVIDGPLTTPNAPPPLTPSASDPANQPESSNPFGGPVKARG